MAWTQNIFSFLIGYCLLAAISAVSWKRKPQSQSVAVGGNVTFHCEINDRGQRTVIWHDSTYNILFQDGNRFNAPANYIIQGEFNLVITNIKKEDNRQFICNVKDLGLESANLTVLLPPEPPSIEANATGNPYRENQVLGLTCKSRGGNPNPTIRWLKNGQVQLDNIINNPAPTIGGVSSSHLAIVLDRTDHQANYTCVVYNEVNAQNPLGTFQVLQVQYSPFITFAPFDDMLNIRDAADATLVCIVDANPPVSTVTWRKNGQPLAGVSKSRVFQPAIKTDTGEYMCIASNGINGAKNGTIMLNVIYPPVISVPTSKTVEEGSSVNITCNYDANPEPYQVHWERISPGSFNVDNSRQLVFDRILRDNAGNYTCKAWSQLKISGEEGTNIMEQSFTYINVEYPPGSAFIRPVGDYNVGDSVELKCSASPEGFPAATFEWKKDGVVQAQNSATYRINRARLSDIGNYICTPHNKVGRGQSSAISLSINEPPTLTESPNNAEIHVPLSDPDPIEIKCVARGRPSPRISWFKNNDNVPLTTLYPSFYTIEQTNTTENTHRYIITNILYFRGGGRNMTASGRTRLRVEDIGNYTCRVEAPSHTDTVSGRASVYVQFKPLVTLGQERVAVDITDTAALPCITRANPVPTFRWYRNNVEVSEGGRYSTRLEVLGETATYQNVLTILDVSQGDLGGYTCRMENPFGNNSKPVILSLKSAPEAPTNLMARSKTWESVSLTWDAGFDGGAAQDFFVRYSAGSAIKEVKVRPSGVTFFNVTKLTPHTSFLFFVYGRNNLGQGALSYGIPVVTEELVIQSLDSVPTFDSSTQMLVVKIGLEPAYCLKVDIRTQETGSRWETVYPCLEMVGDSIEVPGQGVNAMNVSVCLKYRNDVCGSPMQAEISQPPSQGLTERDVIIIACVCAIIIITLLTVLVCFICKRKRNQAKEYTSENPARRPQPINGSVTNSQKTPQAYDNSDGPLELKRNGHIPNREGHLRPNGNIVHDTSYDSQLEKQIFENEMNRRNENNSKGSRPGELQFHGIPRSPTKEKYVDLEEKKEGSLQSGQESGYSTPDPNKPKKKLKLKNMPTNVYYSDFAHFAHDPPGHTCGLPCCREDLRVHIKPPASGYSCMPSHEKVLDDNFTFRRKRLGLIQGRPTFSNRFFSLQHINSEEIYRQRLPIPNFDGRRSVNREEKGPDVVLSDSLENPFVLMTRSGLQEGDHICRRKICLPDSPENLHKITFADFEPGESLDFFDSEDSEDPTVEYYTTTSQNVIKVDTAPIKILNNDTKSETPVGYNNMGFSKDDDVTDDMTSPEHYYDVLQVTEQVHASKAPARLYPDLSTIQESTDMDAFSCYKQKYMHTLAKKKLEPKAVSIPKASTKYDTFPRGREHHPPLLEERLRSWNEPEVPLDNHYEDIEIKHENTNTDDMKSLDNVTTADIIKCDDVTVSDQGKRFGTFGYDGDKSPRKPLRNSNKAELKEKSKRHEPLKDSPITLIL